MGDLRDITQKFRRMSPLITFKFIFMLSISFGANVGGFVCPPTVLTSLYTFIPPLSVLTSTNPDDLEDIFQDIVYLEFPILRILNSSVRYKISSRSS